MQNYSSRFRVKSYMKDEVDYDTNIVLPVTLLLFLLIGNQDENMAKLTKQIMARNGVMQEVPAPALKKKAKIIADPSENVQEVFTLRRPFNLPELNDAQFDGKDLSIRLQLKNTQILDIGPFKVHEKRRDDGLVGVEIDVDNMSLFVTYAIIGSIHGQTFDHRGRTDVFLTDFRGAAQIKHTTDVTTGAFEISKLELDLNFKSLEFGRTGLSVKNIPATELRRVLNSLGKKFLKQNMKGMAGKLSEALKTHANIILGRRSREQIIQILEKHLSILPPKQELSKTICVDYRTGLETSNMYDQLTNCSPKEESLEDSDNSSDH